MPVGPTNSYAPSPVRTPIAGSDVGLGAGVGIEASATIDGTPSRVAGVLLLAGAVLAALKIAGFRFNVGVSS